MQCFHNVVFLIFLHSFYLTVQVPGPAPNLHAVVTSPSTVSLRWDMPLIGNGEIQNYKIYYMEKGMDSEQVKADPTPSSSPSTVMFEQV